MPAFNGTEPSAPESVESALPEKLVIKDHSNQRLFWDKWLSGAQLAMKIVFFIGCGAVVIILERLTHLFKTADGAVTPSATEQPETRSATGQPQRIKVPMVPIDNYNRLDSSEILRRLTGLSNEQLRIVRAYETRQKNREEVLEAIDRHLSMDR